MLKNKLLQILIDTWIIIYGMIICIIGWISIDYFILVDDRNAMPKFLFIFFAIAIGISILSLLWEERIFEQYGIKLVKKIIKLESNQVLRKKQLFGFYEGIIIFEAYYSLGLFDEIKAMEKSFSKLVIYRIDNDKLLFLFQKVKFNLEKFCFRNFDYFENNILRFLSQQENPEEYKPYISDGIYKKLIIKTRNEKYSIDNIVNYLSPLKLKDLPSNLVDINGRVNLNQLTYLLLIPNRKTMTIDYLRKVISSYPHIAANEDLIDFYMEKEVFLPYSEERCLQLLKNGLDSQDLINLAKLQKQGINLQYPEKPHDFKFMMKYIVDNNIQASNFIKLGKSNSIIFNPYEKIPSLKILCKQEFKEYTFKVIENSMELSDLGAELNICVGGYPARGLMNKFQIVAVQKNGKNIYCASINIKTRKIDQIKGKFNGLVWDVELRNFISKVLKS